MRKFSSAFAFTLTFAVLSASGNTLAQAADLGGGCCADLEERIAELEMTTARKGNRKVSVTITGYVTKQIMFWDDGVEHNAYINDIGPTQATNFRITGEATIAPGWKAGYMMRIQDLTDNPMGADQNVSSIDQGLNVQMAHWYIASKDYGKLAVGRNALAAKSAAMFTDLSGTQVIANYVLFDGGAFFMRSNGVLLPVKWGDLGYCYAQQRPWGGDCDGIVMNGVRYDSPVMAGFSISASYGEDDDWEVAGRYTGTVSGFKLAFGIGYSVNTDQLTQPPPISFSKESAVFQVGGYAQHLATGLFLHAAYGEEDNNNKKTLAGFTEPDSNQWYVKGGIRRQWMSLGHTVLYGEAGTYIDQMGPIALSAGATSSEFTRWGVGAVQEIDAASMSIWLKYREHTAEVTGFAPAGIDDFRYVSTGALINF
ncbi:porin [Hyphomicrobium sp. xq]|uniref:Porin n=1 Tax=Hyphomicrobium album TaxID=2665159 RepID=A0A6I3KMS9_9HYPH|nr:porin [Hyphomicrobium album]MTD95210.1 porin [Hyphomicrobium album]